MSAHAFLCLSDTSTGILTPVHLGGPVITENFVTIFAGSFLSQGKGPQVCDVLKNFHFWCRIEHFFFWAGMLACIRDAVKNYIADFKFAKGGEMIFITSRAKTYNTILRLPLLSQCSHIVPKMSWLFANMILIQKITPLDFEAKHFAPAYMYMHLTNDEGAFLCLTWCWYHLL